MMPLVHERDQRWPPSTVACSKLSQAPTRRTCQVRSAGFTFATNHQPRPSFTATPAANTISHTPERSADVLGASIPLFLSTTRSSPPRHRRSLDFNRARPCTRNRGIRRRWHLHNFRIACAARILMLGVGWGGRGGRRRTGTQVRRRRRCLCRLLTTLRLCIHVPHIPSQPGAL